MEYQVGQIVEIRQSRPGANKDATYGRSKIVWVGKLKIKLDDGTEWRTKDGYFWGSQPTRGIGRSLERRIEIVSELTLEKELFAGSKVPSF